MCISYIRRHVSRSSPNSIFTTRHFLSYGARTAVDKALSRLVKIGFLIRIARGVFIRWNSVIPSLLQIAQAKARAFGKELISDLPTKTDRLVMLDQHDSIHTFAVNGASSSFVANGFIINLKHMGPRKVGLGQSKVGQLLRAWWQLGQGQCTRQDIATKIQRFLCPDKEEFFRLVCWMPTWFTKMCQIRPARGTPALWGKDSG